MYSICANAHHGRGGHSPIFVSDDMKTIEIIRDPTHSWAYYASDFLVNVYTHQYKADYHPGDDMFVEYLTPRNDIVDVPCFNFTVEEELETGGIILSILLSIKWSLHYTVPSLSLTLGRYLLIIHTMYGTRLR